VRQRAKNLQELAEKVQFYFAADDALDYDEKALDKFLTAEARARLTGLAEALDRAESWTVDGIETVVRGYCDAAGLKLKHVAQPARVALTGSSVGPGLFETMQVLGRDSTLARFRRVAELG
jgi:glutamyl-tRNA synthetase